MTEDAHSRPTGAAPEPLYDVNVATPTHAERARTLVTQASTGTLCSLALEPEGHPYGSFVTVAFDGGDPVFLLSALAEHTKNLQRDPRASLLVAEDVSDDPLANGRVTLLGSCRPLRGMSRMCVLRSSTRIQARPITPIFATLGFGDSVSNRSVTSEATARCRGSRKRHGRKRSRTRSPRQRPA